jgi:hypothetical protein
MKSHYISRLVGFKYCYYECQNTYPPRRKARADMANGIGQNTTEQASSTVSNKPQSVPRRVFRGFVPHHSYKTETRADCCLKYSEKEAESSKGRKAISCSMACKDNRPQHAIPITKMPQLFKLWKLTLRRRQSFPAAISQKRLRLLDWQTDIRSRTNSKPRSIPDLQDAVFGEPQLSTACW